MFGKLRLPKPTPDALQRSYRAHFCAGCHALREVTGRATSLLTNYDQTLLVLVLSGLWPEAKVAMRPCTAAPWRRVAVQVLPPRVRAYVAAGNVGLADTKLRDDVDDGGGVLPRALRWLLRRRVRQARARLRALGFPVSLLDELPARQRAVEAAVSPTMTTLAEPSAALLAQVFVHGGRLAGRDDGVAALARLGAGVATMVYVVDALEDFATDARRQRFNAVAAVAKGNGMAAALAGAEARLQQGTTAARAAARELLSGDVLQLVDAILQRLAVRGTMLVVSFARAQAVAHERLAEAGHCDCACDGCDGCDGCHAGHSCDGCDACGNQFACCDCWWPTKREVDPPSSEVQDQSHAREAVADLKTLIGRACVAVTALTPKGRVAIDDVEYHDAIAAANTPRGRSMRVVGFAGGWLQVRATP